MKKTEEQDRIVTDALEAQRLAAGSPELRERVLGAARDAWEKDLKALEDDEVSWIGPVFRFAASIVFSIFLVVLAKPASRAFAANETATAVATADRNAAERFVEHQRRLREALEATEARNGKG